MKRSEINRIIDETAAFIGERGFALPPFCRLGPAEWRRRAGVLTEIIRAGLGWDMTDFDLGDFHRTGIVLVTLRNGSARAPRGARKTYCEKIIHMRKDQTCPMHHHRKKTEDIINRGGGTLCFELYTAAPEGRAFSPDGFTIWSDGIGRGCRPGEVIRLGPGESVTLWPFVYHSFWAEDEDVLVGEVSTVNDDVADNVFYREVPRFMTIEEDEAPRYLLVNEVALLLRQ